MNRHTDAAAAADQEAVLPRLQDTRDAFDSVAADYDGPRGNNELIQDMRAEMWRWLARTFPAGSRLLDLGCGTGLDAVHLAKQGFRVTAADWSAKMTSRTAERAATDHLGEQVTAITIGAHELDRLPDVASFDGIYSNLGPLNCVPNVSDVARECARLLKPGGTLVFTVIGRYCPWEVAHYVRQRRWGRALLRLKRSVVPVGMNNHTIWTRYYSPREFYQGFAAHFLVQHIRGICVFAPPPYIVSVRQRFPRLYRTLWALDRKLAATPVIRSMGDHFLIVMKKR